MARLICALILFVLPAVFGLAVDWRRCDNDDKCKISDVNITPCNNPKKCVLKKGNDAQINFSITPEFTTAKLKTGAYAIINGQDNGFKDLDSDGCKLTTCPTEAGKKQEYNYSLHIGKLLPRGTYNLKWKVWDENDETNMCCFQFSMSIKK